MSIRILHYYTFQNIAGGPSKYITTICDSKLKDEYTFGAVYQNKAFSKLRLRDIIRIQREFKLFRPDIVHVHGLQGEGFVGTFIAKIAHVKRVIVTVHGIQKDDISTSRIKKILFSRIFEPLTLYWCDAFYTVCNYTATRKEFIKKKKMIGYIYNPLPVIPEQEEFNFYSDFGISRTSNIITVVGRITEDKGMKVLENIIKYDPNTNNVYFIIGIGDYEKNMKFHLEKEILKGKVKFLGFQSNVHKYLAISKVYLSASFHEHLSIAALEACSMGVPCVLSNVGGSNEIVKHNETGFIFESGDYLKAIEQINKLTQNENLHQVFSDETVKYANDTFSMDKFVDILGNLYRTIL